MRYIWYATAALLLFVTAAEAAPREPSSRGLRRRASAQSSRGQSSRPAGRELDLTKLPVYPGAEQTQQMSFTGDQLGSLGAEVPEKAKAALKKLTGVQILAYKLPKNAGAKKVLAFYEPRILSHGYKLMMKDQGDEKNEITGVYTAPNMGIVVISVSSDEEFPELEIVCVQGGMGGLSGLAALESLEKLAPAEGKAAPEAPSADKPKEAPAAPGSDQEEPEPATTQ